MVDFCKDRIEAVVKFAKYNFAEHRIFSDIATFYKDCQAWLERTGNEKIHGTTKKAPKEVFALEKEHLLPIPNAINELASNTSLTYVVRKDNTVLNKQNRYGVPKGTYCKWFYFSTWKFEFIGYVIVFAIRALGT